MLVWDCVVKNYTFWRSFHGRYAILNGGIQIRKFYFIDL